MKCNVLVPEVMRHRRDCKRPWLKVSENYLRHTDTSSRLSDAGLADTTLPNLGRVPRNMFIERSTYLLNGKQREEQRGPPALQLSLQKAATTRIRLCEGGANSIGHGPVQHIKRQVKIHQHFTSTNSVVNRAIKAVETEAVAHKRATVFERQHLACRAVTVAASGGRKALEKTAARLPDKLFPVTSSVVRAGLAPLMTSAGREPWILLLDSTSVLSVGGRYMSDEKIEATVF